jgi:hypothetical protein
MLASMPRPADVSDEQVAEWLSRFVEPKKDHVLVWTPIMKASSREVIVAGFWLEERLKAEAPSLGEEERDRVLQANGQISFGRDPWAVASISLTLAKKGEVFQPGPQLAEDLMYERLDGVFGIGPSVASRAGVQRLKEALGVRNLQDLLIRTGSTTLEEAQTKIKGEVNRIEEEEGFSR